MIFGRSEEHRFFVPEVIQTSAMDCGPATLKCMLEGFGIPVSYGRLREACQTDVDGTSISVIEEVAVQLGLEAEQIMTPADYLLLPEMEALPAIVVVLLPNGFTHFVVVWGIHGRFVQVMDPATGRRWPTCRRFLNEVYIHTHPISPEDWIEWAESEEFRDILLRRLTDLKINDTLSEQLIRNAAQDPGWQSSAALDAAIRMVSEIVRARGLETGKEAGAVVEHFFNRARKEGPVDHGIIPATYWSVALSQGQGQNEYIMLKGAVLVRALERRSHEPDSEEDDDAQEIDSEPETLSPELAAALEESPPNPETEVLQALREDGLLIPSVLVMALCFASLAVVIQGLLLRGILDVGQSLSLTSQRVGAAGAFFAFFLLRLLLSLPMTTAILSYGRRLEIRMRVALLRKIPRLGDRYFHSRLTSDMAERAHELRGLRSLPDLGVSIFRLIFQTILTSIAIIWLNPVSAPIAVMATILFVTMSFITQPLLREQDLRIRTLIGAISRFYLDSLLGLTPIRTHTAERSVRRQHEGLMVDWAAAEMSFFRVELLVLGVEALIGAGFTVWILFNYINRGGDPGGILLLMYWTLGLPDLGKALANTVQQYPMHRNRLLRLLEPLSAPEETEILSHEEDTESASDMSAYSDHREPSGSSDDKEPSDMPASGMAITFEHISVHAGGHIILSDIDTKMAPGEHIAIVGPSGAGKSSLVGLLLGWHRPASGDLLIDGFPLKGERIHGVRRATAWVDPSVQLWNRSLMDNLTYGGKRSVPSDIGGVIERADLFDLLEKLPDGLQTRLGEGGGLVSGGEGQRVRLGRAMLRDGVRLAILDEPFRGLDREKRTSLLTRARRHWQKATLIFISHDVRDTLTFDRVLVIEDGRVLEDGIPESLANRPNSRYHALLAAEDEVRKGLWESAEWRRLWLEDGYLK